MKIKITLLALSVAASPAFAKLADQQGFSGEISINTGVASSTSNFNTDADSNLSSRNQKASSESSFLIAPLGSVAYTFGDKLNHQVYTGTARDDVATGTVVLEVGYKYQLESGMVIDASLLPTIMSGETWADPYNTTSARTKTDETGNAFRLKLSSIAGSAFSLDMAYATKEVDQDDIEQQELKRDANTLYLKGQYRLPLSRTMMLIPSVIYQTRDADGNAESYDQFGGEVSLFGGMGRHQYALTAGYNQRSYDASNPIYDKKRSDDNINLFAAYEYDQFMDWENWSFVSLAGYGTSDSNITFYDESQYIVSVGLNYKF
ncbi:DUF2860 domain-containing protein [Vibrio sp. 10N.261.46.E12]|uniref:DUF2860 domain-containing protein n=1 Tax=unclassified Vibrio TaxID=2614977 RepID=UPI000978528C|nr:MULTISPECIES: DUF2860 domain-containing protein [unclassified Vibrio]OMO35784.1 hypothetical protein BH584_07240 [Vibrio sp. 10N.261.45.E1]PMJ21604.1 hypothetical protein BCU27_18055 [Vibrio sp. 10N.286.45.B6]PML84989.1 hypothetical protein BCT66_16340 [Vibrio sp. 10N.261.49.E11]PMM72481.1 hypothetical protein BCT48_06590 [Vibrio sp. 10N.261.46.F12]PMM81113.1 hypothetical protein BCT46_16455 [Vibrio sp. 10N.261.46.E8]